MKKRVVNDVMRHLLNLAVGLGICLGVMWVAGALGGGVGMGLEQVLYLVFLAAGGLLVAAVAMLMGNAVVDVVSGWWSAKASKVVSKNQVGAGDEGDEVFAGFVSGQGFRVEVHFAVKKGASQAEMDSAFLGALSEQARVDYLQVSS